MNRKLPIVIASIFGSFFIYCVQSPHGFGGQGPVSDASADTSGACCALPAEKFVVITSGTLTSGGAKSDPIPVGAYREVVVYSESSLYCSTNQRLSYAQFRANANAAFGNTGQDIVNGARVRVDGADLRLQATGAGYTTCTGQINYTVAGVQ
jgi:hypothetical protein